MQQDVTHRSIECIIDDFAMMMEVPVPKLHELLPKRHFHLIAEYVVQPLEQCLSILRAKKVKCGLVYIKDPDFAHALPDEFGVDVHKRPKIGDASMPDVI